ncbi:hypothetical protein JF544_08095 [Halobacillus kuroshimensis]|uniref:Polysaccharide chain length determinant N-terminal domain-containing protein n=1 Tax=Halobacillus kuroshimensis TaxID=302481 RepID=A0ABS3DVC9_9BACI|nr:Wzz/FepE/Etk N-terminal domain-containing protein [Halobacillus kuroshimensis]MBN8235209.1 hypothetical protein [Halobacillus kuroshimensis]
MEENMDIKSFLAVLKRRMVTIMLVSSCLFLLACAVTFFVMKPTYESVENLVVGKLNKEDSEYGESKDLNMLLASTIDIVQSPNVLNAVSREFNIPYDELKEQIVVKNSQDSQVVSILVRGEDPDEVSQIANFTALTTVQKMNDLFEVKDILVLNDSSGENGGEQVGSQLVNLVIGLVVGLLAGIGGAVVKDHLDGSVQSASQLEKEIGVRSLGEVDLKKKLSGRKLQKKHREQKTLRVVDEEKRGEMSV